MKRAHNEKGYTLFLVVLMIVVFSVISMSLITVTISGAKRSEVRENVTQAGELAEKGLNRLVQQIRADIQAEIPEEGLSKEDFIQTINKVKERYKCEDSTTSLVQSETGKYGACINLNDEGLNKSEDAIPHKLLLNTIGESNEKEKELEAVVEIDGNAIPDKMAVTTFIRDECTDNINKCHDGEGNLFLSGFVGIQGHLNVDRYLITSNRSYQKYAASHHWIQSYFPAVLKQEDGSQSEIIVGEKDFYRMAWDPKAFKGTLMTKLNDNYLEYNEHIKLTHNIKDELPYRKMDAITDELFKGGETGDEYVPIYNDRENVGRNPIDVSKIIAEKEAEFYQKYYNRFTSDDPGVTVIETGLIGADTGGVDRVILHANYGDKKVVPKWYSNFGGTFYLRGNSTFKQFSTDGNIRIDGGALRRNIINFKESAYVGGDLEIRGNSEVRGPIYVNGNLKIANTERDIVIEGPIYVNGNMEVNAKNLTLNSDIYVNGNLKVGGANLRRANMYGNYYIGGNFDVSGNLIDTVPGANYNVMIYDATYVGGNAVIRNLVYNDSFLDEHNIRQILYADGEIIFDRINRFNDRALEIEAFYYSNTSIQMDGNESKLTIKGGIAAPRIVLNSVGGRVYSGIRARQNKPIIVDGRSYDGIEDQNNPANGGPRLRIVYNDSIYKDHEELMLDSRITYVLTPKITELK